MYKPEKISGAEKVLISRQVLLQVAQEQVYRAQQDWESAAAQGPREQEAHQAPEEATTRSPAGLAARDAAVTRSRADAALALAFFHRLQRPPLCGWSAVATQVALTYAAIIVVGLAAYEAKRLDLIRSPKQVLAYLWEPHGCHP